MSLLSDLPECHFLVIKEFLFQSSVLGGRAGTTEEGASLREASSGSVDRHKIQRALNLNQITGHREASGHC